MTPWFSTVIKLRRSTIVVFAGLVAIAAPQAGAQASINVGIGAAVPIGSSADRLSPGYTTTLAFAFQPNWMHNDLRLEGAVISLAAKSAASKKRQILSATANVIISGKADAVPAGYVIVGAGSYQASGGISRRTDYGVNVGAGVRFSLGFFGTFVEARLHYVADDTKTKYFPMTFGLTF